RRRAVRVGHRRHAEVDEDVLHARVAEAAAGAMRAGVGCRLQRSGVVHCSHDPRQVDGAGRRIGAGMLPRHGTPASDNFGTWPSGFIYSARQPPTRADSAMPVITCIEDLRLLAKRRVPKMFYEYADSGAWTESTYRANETDFAPIRLRQRVAVDIDKRSLVSTMVGQPVSMPIALAPVGLTGMQHAD